MNPTVLITYATKHGSTREVAETIARAVEQHGLSVDVHPAREVGDLTGFDAVILGTALYMGRPHADARRFPKRYHEPLSRVPVAVFGMGPLTTGDDDVAGARKQLERALAAVSDVTPVSTAIFGGVVKPDDLHFPFRHMKASDARNWADIEAWGREVATLLAERLTVPV